MTNPEPIDLWPVIERSMTKIMRGHGHTDQEIVAAIEILWKEYEAGKRGESVPRMGTDEPKGTDQKKYTGRRWSHASASHPED